MAVNIELKQVEKRYVDFHLQDISFQVEEGSIMGLIGANGAGKSTTIQLILDMIERDGGEIMLFGKENTDVSLREDIGVVFDECCFPETMTVAQLGKMMSRLYKNWEQLVYEDYLKRFQLSGKSTSIKDFSRGMKMKLELAVALSHQAKLLVLDEPTGGLDPIVRNEILDIFLEFIQDETHSILLSSHITTDLEKIADYITFIDQGRVLASDNKDELLYQYGIMKGKVSDLEHFDRKQLIGLRETPHGFEALVKGREKMAHTYPEMVVEPSTLEEIMLFMVRENNKQ